MITINIATDYTKTPGGRFIYHGEDYGQHLPRNRLKPKFLQALENNDQLTVILDGGYGYATSFLEEAFGGLAREMRNSKIKDIIIISEEEPQLISKIQQYITDALK